MAACKELACLAVSTSGGYFAIRSTHEYPCNDAQKHVISNQFKPYVLQQNLVFAKSAEGTCLETSPYRAHVKQEQFFTDLLFHFSDEMSSGKTLKSSVPLPNFNLDRTLVEFVLDRCGELQSRDVDPFWMVEHGSGASVKYKDVDHLTRNIASALCRLGMRKGDTAIYLTGNYVQTHLFFVGVWRANGTVRASDPVDTADTIKERMIESRSRWIFCDSDSFKNCQKAVKSLNWEVTIIHIDALKGYTNLAQLMEDDGASCPELSIKWSDPAIVLNTSGTTGKSKGALYNHRGILALIQRHQLWPPGKRTLCLGKPTHISGLLFPLMNLNRGVPLMHVSTPAPLILCEAIHQFRPDMLFAFPTHIIALMNFEGKNFDLSSLRTFITGGIVLSAEVKDRMLNFHNVSAVIDLMGMTETNFCVSNLDYSTKEEFRMLDLPAGATGKVMPGTEVKVIDFDTGNPVGPNTKGELCFRKSDAMMVEYLNNPTATSEAFTSDGWLRSGDVAYYDEAEVVYVCGRAKETFKYYADQVSPADLDDVIGQHEAVSEVCTIGIPDPDGGTVPRAFVTLKPCLAVAATEIKAFANSRLASFEQLRGGLYVVDELPKGSTGKISRRLVEEMSRKFYSTNADIN